MNNIKTLDDKYNSLKNRLLDLLDEWYYLKFIKIQNLNFTYDRLFGEIEYELNQKDYQANQIQNKINEITNFKYASNYSSTLLSQNDFIEYDNTSDRELMLSYYRKIVKCIHPDSSKNIEITQNYWEKIQFAYKTNNLRHLEIYFVILIDADNKDINKSVSIFEKYVREEEINLNILKQKEPYSLENKFNDYLWVRNKQKSLQNKLESVNKRLTLKEQLYKTILSNQNQNNFHNAIAC